MGRAGNVESWVAEAHHRSSGCAVAELSALGVLGGASGIPQGEVHSSEGASPLRTQALPHRRERLYAPCSPWEGISMPTSALAVLLPRCWLIICSEWSLVMSFLI